MKLRINNIVLHGTFSPVSKQFNNREQQIKIFQNKISRLNTSSFNISVSRNIYLTLIENKFGDILKKAIREVHGIKLRKLRIRVSNFNQNATILGYKSKLLKYILPALHKHFGIEEAEVTQEANSPTPIALDKILNANENFNFIKILIKLLNKRVTIGFQLGKNKESIHLSIITTAWTDKIHELMVFLEKEEWS